MSSTTPLATRSDPLRVLTFHVGDVRFAVPILDVREIVGLCEITRVPDTPPEVLGVVNLRGRIVPVIDSRRRFGMPARETDERACIVVFDTDDSPVGAIVDRVADVLDVEADVIDPAPPAADGRGAAVRALARLDDGVAVILDTAAFTDCSVAMELPQEAAPADAATGQAVASTRAVEAAEAAAAGASPSRSDTPDERGDGRREGTKP